MFVINEDKSIYVTRGDAVWFGVSATDNISGEKYMFQPGDIVRLKVTAKKDCENVVLLKEFPVTAETEVIEIAVDGSETKFGDVISKPTDYWYEVELESNGIIQTIIGYDDDGARVFKLYPEAEGVIDGDTTLDESIYVSDVINRFTNEINSIGNEMDSIDKAINTLSTTISNISGRVDSMGGVHSSDITEIRNAVTELQNWRNSVGSDGYAKLGVQYNANNVGTVFSIKTSSLMIFGVNKNDNKITVLCTKRVGAEGKLSIYGETSFGDEHIVVHLEGTGKYFTPDMPFYTIVSSGGGYLDWMYNIY